MFQKSQKKSFVGSGTLFGVLDAPKVRQSYCAGGVYSRSTDLRIGTHMSVFRKKISKKTFFSKKKKFCYFNPKYVRKKSFGMFGPLYDVEWVPYIPTLAIFRDFRSEIRVGNC